MTKGGPGARRRVPRRARPPTDRPAGVPARPVRRRAGLGALPRGARRPRRCRARCRPSSSRASPRPARPTTTRAGSASASAWPRRRSSPTAPTSSRQRFLRPLFTRRGGVVPALQRARRRLRPRRRWPPARCATATSGSSTGRRCGPRSAHLADWGMLVARTDPDVPKHAGLTYFVVDMHDPGVEVRPLRQITGEAEFNEVFLTDVADPRRRPARRRRRRAGGSPHDHAHERAGRHRRSAPSRARAAWSAWSPQTWRERPELRTPELHDRLLQLWVEAEVARLTGQRLRQKLAAGAARAGGLGDEAVLRPAQPGSSSASRSSCSARRACATTTGRCAAPSSVDFIGRGRRLPLPAREGQLDRGRHLGDPAQHRRRARARPARRAPRRQGRRLEGPAAMRSPRVSQSPRADEWPA